MQSLLRVAGATLNQTPMDWIGNEQRIRKLLREARAQGVELLCLPELCISGYGCEDGFLSMATARRSEEVLERLLPETKGLTVLIGLPYYFEGAMFNTAALIQNTKILGLNAKRLLPREGVHYEPRWFEAWPFGEVVPTTVAGQKTFLGDISYGFGEVGVAVEICEEAWGATPGAAAHAGETAVVLNPSASHFALGKYAVRERLVTNSSRAMGVHYVYSNLVGLEAGRIIYDGGVLIAESGKLVARGRRFGLSDGELTIRDLDLDLVQVAKLRQRPVRAARRGRREVSNPLNQPEVKSGGGRVIQGVSLFKSGKKKRLPKVEETSPLSKEEEFLEAEMLGLFDAMRKSQAKGFVVSLSGGCDSAACATLVAQMIATGIQELGSAAFAQRIGRPELAKKAESKKVAPKQYVADLLACLYQRTESSGKPTHDAAEGLAKALGATFFSFDVTDIVASYSDFGNTVMKRPLSWSQDDLALQNIQARARAPLAWLVANLRGALLLTTSNRSEASVGYATMDGDTAGGLAPLAGIDKHFLRQWLRWAETSCTRGLGAIGALAPINKMAPTAELRPKTMGQTDEADLMPYEVLDRIERLLIGDKLDPAEILGRLVKDFPKRKKTELSGDLKRFLTLWSRSQWKRERIAPGFHLDDVSVDPKTWCRYPILNGGFRREMGEG